MGMQFRSITYLPIKANSLKEADSISPFKPENTVLFAQPKKGSVKFEKYDFGRFCFTRKDEGHASKANPETGYREYRVDLSSFRPERVEFVGKTIEFLREQEFSERSVVDLAAKTIRFFKFIEDEASNDEWLNTKRGAISCYQKYIEYLTHRARLPETAPNSMTSHGAAGFAKAARELVCYAYGLSQKEIERKVPSLKHFGKTNVDPASQAKRQKFIYVCLSIFEQFQAAILDEKPFPWLIDLSNAGIDQQIIWRGRTNKKSIYVGCYFTESGEIKTETEMADFLDSLGFTEPKSIVKFNGEGKTTRSSIAKHHRDISKYLKELNSDPDQYQTCLRRSYDLATYCFWYPFLAATGLNYSVASELRHGSEEYIPERGYSFSGLKVRAGNKIVYADFKKTFEPFFKKFSKLRSWALSQLEIDPPYWFFVFDYLGAEGDNARFANNRKIMDVKKDSFKKIFSGKNWALKNFIKQNKIPVEQFSPSELRKGVSFDWYKASGGDSALVSKKLGNNIKTVEKTYSGASEEDAYVEMSEYYSLVIEAVKEKGRSSPGTIPVKLLDDDADENLPLGSCENIDFAKPKRANQFGEGAPHPDCSRSETCLFCEHFAIHADEKGLRKLLSFRELFPLIKARVGSIDRYITIFAPIEARIEEILEHIKASYPKKSKLVEGISEEVSQGELDEFWEHHFYFLEELGYAE